MDERSTEATGHRPGLPFGLRIVALTLLVPGGFAGCALALVLLFLLTAPGITTDPSGTWWFPLAIGAAFGGTTLLCGWGLWNRRGWALGGAEASLVAVALSALVIPGIGPLLMIGLLAMAVYLGRPSVKAAYRMVARPGRNLPGGLVRAAAILEPPSRFLGGLGLLGLAAVSVFVAITIQPVKGEQFAELGALIGRGLAETFAAAWLVCGVLTLWLRHRAFPAGLGAAITLLVSGFFFGGQAPSWPGLVIGSIGLLLLTSVGLQAMAGPADVPPAGLPTTTA
jgi:hypothetical protein